SIMATSNCSLDQKAEYMTATVSLFSFFTSCSRAGSICALPEVAGGSAAYARLGARGTMLLR
ncbi:MAG: hypothetical protein ACYDC3_11670, partial [Candidatus Binataceae bacterium]